MTYEIDTTNAVNTNSDTAINYDVVLRHDVSDEAMEAAAVASAFSYTYQTSAYRRCCR